MLLRYVRVVHTKKWSELSTVQRTVVVSMSAAETVLTVAALYDLARRPEEQVRGSKWAWAVGAFVQPVGPIAYFWLGRVQPSDD